MQPIQYNSYYQPHRLLNAITRLRGLRNDTELANFLEVGRALICKVRRGSLPISGALLLRIHDATAIEIWLLKELSGDRRQWQRASDNKIVSMRPRKCVRGIPFNDSTVAALNGPA